MGNFFYRARNKNNEILNGSINASNISDAAAKLEYSGLAVLEITADISHTSAGRNLISITGSTIFSLKEKKEFINAFYFQYKSGCPIQEIFRLTAQNSSNENIRSLSLAVLKHLENGESLKEAFMRYYKALGRAYTMLICAGETSGKLDEILSSLIKNLQREEEIKSNIISSLTYPACMLCLAIAVFILFKTCIFKVFESMFTGISREEVYSLLFLSVINIIIVFVILGGLIFFLIKNKKTKYFIVNFFTSLPFVSKILKDYYFQNFFTIFSLAYEAGIPTVEAVELASSILNTTCIKNKIKKSVNMMQNGCELTTAFMVSGIFSQYAISQISTGEKSGELDKLLKTIANDYAQKVETSIGIITKLTEPAILIFIGILVCYILVNGYSKYYESLSSML